MSGGLMQPGPTLTRAEEERRKRGSMGLLGAIGEPLSYAPGPVGLLGNALLSAQYLTGEKPIDEGLSALAMMTGLMQGTKVAPIMRVVNPKDAERIAKYAEQMGLNPSTDRSTQSSSRYVTAFHPSVDGGLKVRVSDHDLPRAFERYENAGTAGVFEVGSGSGANRAGAAGDWRDAVRWLADRTGAQLPPSFSAAAKAAQTRSESAIDKAAAAQLAIAQNKRQRAVDAVANGTAKLTRTNGGYWLYVGDEYMTNVNRSDVPAEVKASGDQALIDFLLARVK